MAKIFTKLNIGDTVATSGTRVFKKLTTEILPDYGNAGLYDADNNLVASWDELVNTYGMDVEKDYTSLDYQTDTASPYYLLIRSHDLSAGTKLVISNAVTRIGNYAFSNCINLTNVTIGNSVTSIGFCAFVNCIFTSINIPNSVTNIEDLAFIGCGSLTEVTIPDSVTNIGYAAFSHCTNLTDVYYRGTAEGWAAIAVGTDNSYLTNATIHYNYTG